MLQISSHNNQKKVAGINDISGFGRCSTTVSLPIISYMKIQYCPVITSIFSNHTAYESYFFDDYTEKMIPYIAEWEKLGLAFEGIYTGFLGSVEQIDIVKEFIRHFKTERTMVIVDPVMGDDGFRYTTYTDEMCREMKQLVSMADIITPNLTECCILTDTSYHSGGWTQKKLNEMAQKLAQFGPRKIVITGIHSDSYIGNFVYQEGESSKLIKTKKVGSPRCGTGDIFSAIICGDAVNGVNFEESVRKASQFVKKCIEVSEQKKIPKEDGACFEEVLHSLKI